MMKLFLLLAVIMLSRCASIQPHHETTLDLTYDRIVGSHKEIIHMATVNLTHHRLVLYLPKNSSLQTVSEVAQETGALVAINAGFFTKEGRPVGMHKLNGTIMQKPSKNRGVMGYNAQGEFFFDRLQMGATSFKSAFFADPWWEKAENIVSGAPLLIREGKALDVEPEGTMRSFIDNRYARTAVCIDSHGNLRLVVVNGGDSKTYAMGGGMSIAELTEFLLSQNCVHALNLDGGYSSSFILAGKRKNSYNLPFLQERAVSSMLLIFPR